MTGENVNIGLLITIVIWIFLSFPPFSSTNHNHRLTATEQNLTGLACMFITKATVAHSVCVCVYVREREREREEPVAAADGGLASRLLRLRRGWLLRLQIAAAARLLPALVRVAAGASCSCCPDVLQCCGCGRLQACSCREKKMKNRRSQEGIERKRRRVF